MTCTPVGRRFGVSSSSRRKSDPSTGNVLKVGQQPVKTAPTVVPDSLSI